MNIVIPFRNTCGTKELEMCLKLIKKNINANVKVFIIGDELDFETPSFVINKYVEERKFNRWLDSSFLVAHYILEYGHNQPFVLFNDDFFITSKINEEDLKNYYYVDTISKRLLTTYVINPKTEKLRLSDYGLNLKQFINSYRDYYNFEVHLPLYVQYPQTMVEAIEDCKLWDCPALKRTLYMMYIEAAGLVQSAEYQALPHDCKFGEPLRIMQYPFFSSTETEFNAFEDEFNKLLEK